MNAKVLFDETPLLFFPETDSDVMTTLKQGDVVAVIEKPSLIWWKVAHNEFTGYINSKYVKSENGNDLVSVLISIPRDSAIELYKALKFALL